MTPIRRKLTMQLPETVHQLSRAFKDAGYELYVVGGAVRDAVMGQPPKDIDLATNATPDQVMDVRMKMLPLPEADLTGKAFGVVRIRMLMDRVKELCEFEIATFREDISAGRHPEVRFATIKEDVQRRDLTINALFYDIDAGEVVDLVGGLADIEKKVIRTVGNPYDRFAEDPLRKLRALRFATRFDYSMDVDTFYSIGKDNTLTGVSFERIHDELVRSIAGAKNVRRLMKWMDDLDLWTRVLPGLKASTKLDSLVSTRGIDTNCVPIALALLLDGEDVDTLPKRLNYLKYSAEEINAITFLLRFRGLGPGSAYRMRKVLQSSGLTLDMAASYFIQRGMPDRATMTAFTRYAASPPVKGDALMAEGFSGKALGVELERRERELFEGLVGV
jgi:tRNA nucleotidyltransferase/poly(A) polymerase